uniref:PHP domain-like protein n=1 Tax=Panagrellus redivivus TaxID=6233 RepID=A0A7E4VJU9_PANRE
MYVFDLLAITITVVLTMTIVSFFPTPSRLLRQSGRSSSDQSFGRLFGSSWLGVDSTSASLTQSGQALKSAHTMSEQRSKFNGFQFADLNLVHSGDVKRTTQLVGRALKMGYDAVAINIDVGDPFCGGVDKIVNEIHGEPVPKKKRKQMAKEANVSEHDAIPKPFKVDLATLDQTDLKVVEANGRVFRQFSRLTVTLSDTTSIHKLANHPRVKLYDLVAVRLADPTFLTTLSKKGDIVDIVTFPVSSSTKPCWLYQPKLIRAVAAEGLGFELTYGEALHESANRQLFISYGTTLAQTAGPKGNLFLSSGATDVIQIRGAYDVANFSCLINTPTSKGIHYVSTIPKAILLRSQARRLTLKGAWHVTDISAVPSKDKTPAEALKDLLKIEEFSKQAELKSGQQSADAMEVDA